MRVSLSRRIATGILVVLIVAVVVFPFFMMALSSLKRNLDILESPPNFSIRAKSAVKNYRTVLFSRNFLQFTRNSIAITSSATVLALLIGIPTAYGFSRFEFRGKRDLAFWILSARFMPPIAVVIPIYLMMRRFHLLDTYPGLILPYVAFNLPFVVWIMMGFFNEIPRELDESAMIDGCSRLSILWRIVLPLAAPGLVTTAIFCIIFTWNEFLIALFIVSTAKSQTVTVGAAGLMSMERSIEWNVTTAVGVVTIIPVLVFSFFVQKHIVRGLTAGATF